MKIQISYNMFMSIILKRLTHKLVHLDNILFSMQYQLTQA